MRLLDHTADDKIMKMVYRGITFIYVILIFLFLTKTDIVLWRSILLAFMFLIHVIRHRLKDKNIKNIIAMMILTIAEFIVMVVAFINTGTEIENTIFVLFTADVIIRYKLWFSLPVVYGGYAVYLYLWTPPGNDLVFFVMSIINQSLMFLPMWAARVLLSQRKTILLLNNKILEQSATMENIATLKERNRIAEEVHDTVGHTLTTAIVALEGANMLFNVRPDEAHDKIVIAKKQLKIGLSDIRTVVKQLKLEDKALNRISFEEDIRQIIRDVESQTELKITFIYSIKTELVSLQEHVIKNVIKEGLTNAIKHGNADMVKVELVSEDEVLNLLIKDNGHSGNKIDFGFGLSSMQSRLEALGGTLTFNINKKGFELVVKLPIARGE